MDWARASLNLALGVLIGCGDDGSAAGTETDAQTESGTAATAASTGTEGESADTMAGPPTGTEGNTTEVVTGSDLDSTTADSATGTDGCPVGTDGCPCDVGSTCDDGLTCNGDGVCEPLPACRPLDTEPHDDEATATVLNELNCGNELDLGVIGTLEGPQTDWYRYFGDEGAILCSEQPLVTITADIETDVCVFIECLEGNATGVGCAGGSTAADSPQGRPGCCGVDEAHLNAYDCGGFFTPNNLDIWISVGTADAVCADYGLVYSF
ncbi:MAG: hypothetical protein AB1Z98_19500 [Nannocystaceae bacterium]